VTSVAEPSASMAVTATRSGVAAAFRPSSQLAALKNSPALVVIS
jgi:hypothetical protein